MRTRILLLHNILWSRYKAIVFSEFNKLMEDFSCEFFVLQFARTDNQRKGLGEIELVDHNYPYELMLDSNLDEAPWYLKVFKTFKVLTARQFDVIIIPGYAYIMCWCALIYAKTTNKIVIVSFDSTADDNPKYWWKESIKRWYISKCSAAMCYGIKSKEYLMKLGMPSENIFTRCQAIDNQNIELIHNNAIQNRDSDQFKENLRPHNFVYVGRLSKEKNLEILLSTYSKMKLENEQAADWGLILVGDGPEKAALQQLASKLRVRDVFFAGGKSWREIPRYHALSDVLVLPSLSEPWGLVVNEAMVCGLPVIVSNRCGAAHDLVREGENGFTFDPMDGPDLQKKLAFFVDHLQAATLMGEQSRRIITDYSPRMAALQMMRCIKFVTADRMPS